MSTKRQRFHRWRKFTLIVQDGTKEKSGLGQGLSEGDRGIVVVS